MNIEEMARAYAEGFSEEYREVAYEAFLCGYGAKCTTEATNDLEEAAEEWAKECYGVNYLDFERTQDGAFKAMFNFKSGAKWQKEQMMKEAVEGEVAIVTYPNRYKFIDCEVPQELNEGDKVRVIVLPKE